MPSVLIDAGYFVALEYARDQYHRAAINHWDTLSRDRLDLVTTSYVLDEVVAFLVSRGYHNKAVFLGNALLESSAIEIIHVDQPLLLEAWSYFQRHDDKRYSLTDCISFVVMSERKIQTAYAFDRNFVQAGFVVGPT